MAIGEGQAGAHATGRGLLEADHASHDESLRGLEAEEQGRDQRQSPSAR